MIRAVDRAAWRLLMWAATLHPAPRLSRPRAAVSDFPPAPGTQGPPAPKTAPETPLVLVRRPGDRCAHCARPADPIWAVITPRGPRDACSPEHAQTIRHGGTP